MDAAMKLFQRGRGCHPLQQRALLVYRAFVGLVGLKISFYHLFLLQQYEAMHSCQDFLLIELLQVSLISRVDNDSNVWGCWVPCMSLALNSWLCILWDGSKTTRVCGRSLFMFLQDIFLALLNLWLLIVAEKNPHFLILSILPSDLLISIVSIYFLYSLLVKVSEPMQFYTILLATSPICERVTSLAGSELMKKRGLILLASPATFENTPFVILLTAPKIPIESSPPSFHTVFFLGFGSHSLIVIQWYK